MIKGVQKVRKALRYRILSAFQTRRFVNADILYVDIYMLFMLCVYFPDKNETLRACVHACAFTLQIQILLQILGLTISMAFALCITWLLTRNALNEVYFTREATPVIKGVHCHMHLFCAASQLQAHILLRAKTLINKLSET